MDSSLARPSPPTLLSFSLLRSVPGQNRYERFVREPDRTEPFDERVAVAVRRPGEVGGRHDVGIRYPDGRGIVLPREPGLPNLIGRTKLGSKRVRLRRSQSHVRGPAA